MLRNLLLRYIIFINAMSDTDCKENMGNNLNFKCQEYQIKNGEIVIYLSG